MCQVVVGGYLFFFYSTHGSINRSRDGRKNAHRGEEVRSGVLRQVGEADGEGDHAEMKVMSSMTANSSSGSRVNPLEFVGVSCWMCSSPFVSSGCGFEGFKGSGRCARAYTYGYRVGGRRGSPEAVPPSSEAAANDELRRAIARVGERGREGFRA